MVSLFCSRRPLALVHATGLAVLFLLFASAPVAAVEPVRVELNKLETIDDACRAYLLLRNESQHDFDELKLDLVMFNPEGVVARRLSVDVGPLPQQKTSLKVFDISAMDCAGIGRLLLNDVVACADTAGIRNDCLAMIAPSARGTVEFIK